jgi:hypothetical protein
MVEVKKRMQDLSLKLDLMKEAVSGVLEFWSRFKTHVDYSDKRQEMTEYRVNIRDTVGRKNDHYIFRVRESNENGRWIS